MKTKQKPKPMFKPKNGNKKLIDKSEALMIVLFATFGIIWIAYISPTLQYSKFYLSLNPVEAYIVYNSGIIALSTALLGIPVGYFIKGDVNVLDMIRGGVASFLSISLAYDMLEPPWAWNMDGTIAIVPTPDNMQTASVDYMVGWVYEQFGVHGRLLWIGTYIVVPILAVLVMALILKPKELLKTIMGK